MAEILKPLGDHTVQHESTEDIRGTVVSSAGHNIKGRSPQLQLVQAEIDEGESTVYDHGLYRSLAAGRLAGQSDGVVISEAARLTKAIRNNTMEYDEAYESTLAVAPAPPAALVRTVLAQAVPVEAAPAQAVPAEAVVVDNSGAAVNPDALHSKAPVATVREEFFLPGVKVAYEGQFGTIRTRYHSVEETSGCIVLTFDKRCEIVDMYAPPQSDGLIKILIGDNDVKQYYVQSMGINLDLDAQTVNRYIIVLPVVPDNHELVSEHAADSGELMDGELDPSMALPGEPAGMSGMGQTSL